MPHQHEAMELTNEQIERYSRHLLLPEIGVEGQKKLKAARILIVGAGGLGSPAALYLAGAGVGHLGLVDADVVRLSNLQRQILHGTATLGHAKVESAKSRLLDFNPDIRVEVYNEAFTSESAERIAGGYDLILDGTDNFPTRYLINDVALRLSIPFVYGAIFRMEGQASVFGDSKGPCYRCIFPIPPAPESVMTCSEAGVLGVVPGLIGTIQATEAIKWILGLGTSLAGRLLIYDAGEMQFDAISIEKNLDCPACGRHDPATIPLIDYDGFCGVPGTNQDNIALPDDGGLSATELKAKLDSHDPIILIDVRRQPEWGIVHLDGSVLIPLDELEDRLDEFSPLDEVVVVCRSGRRSARAVVRLRERGFKRARSLIGGLLAWAQEVDPSLPQY
ncbi:molybdopterin-synthase adenylyltransferase MoeB [Candidatus Bipolaricaulota bacterium]